MTNTLGTNIAKLRESQKLTQEELGKLSGVSRVSIYKIETGQSTPRDTTLQHIAEALHTTPSALRSNQNEAPHFSARPSQRTLWRSGCRRSK